MVATLSAELPQEACVDGASEHVEAVPTVTAEQFFFTCLLCFVSFSEIILEFAEGAVRANIVHQQVRMDRPIRLVAKYAHRTHGRPGHVARVRAHD